MDELKAQVPLDRASIVIGELTLDSYHKFIHQKSQLDGNFGFSPLWIPPYLFDFQAHLVEWAVKKGRAAIFADCGMGKTVVELVWAQNVYKKTGKPVLILTPLAVAAQFVQEAQKFEIEAARSHRGEIDAPIVIINYERIHLLDTGQFGGIICDESSILKDFNGMRRKEITELMRLKPYRLLGTATAAPNDYIELGTSSEALGYLGYMDMLSRFFTNKKRTSHQMRGRWRDGKNGWRFKGHAEQPFWRWVSSWARALRYPSDLGYDDDGFILPELNITQHIVKAETPPPGMLFNLPAVGWREQRAERKRTIQERCEKVADLVNHTGKPTVVWCSYNAEGNLLEKLIPDAQQVSGQDSNENKEAKLEAFSNGEIRILVTKPKIGAWGLNWQHCDHITWFPSHCYDEITEVLTKRGWLRFGDISLIDEIATVNPGTLAFEWQQPSDIIWEQYIGPMIRFGSPGATYSRSFDLLVTPNHKMFVKRDEKRYRTNSGEWLFIDAIDLLANWKRQEYKLLSAPLSFSGFYPQGITIPFPESVKENHSKLKRMDWLPTKTFLMLAGWYIAEGYCGSRGGRLDGQITISQTDKNPENRKEIILLLQSMPGLTVYTKTKDIRCCSSQLAHYLVDQFGAGAHNKKIPHWVKELDSSLLELLRDTMLKGDGCGDNGVKWFYRTVSETLANDFAEICIKTGLRASVRYRQGIECYDVSLARNNTEPSIHVRPEVIDYTGMIGCVTVPNHTLIVRRNGIPVISGNSYEQYYQAVRRCWRFGQKNPVTVDIVMTEGERFVQQNLEKKAKAADEMFSALVKYMNSAIGVDRLRTYDKKTEVPAWL